VNLIAYRMLSSSCEDSKSGTDGSSYAEDTQDKSDCYNAMTKRHLIIGKDDEHETKNPRRN
jgi:hypothetical protein